MKVIVLRHASRSVDGFGDSHLSETGRNQAENFVAAVAPRGGLPKPAHLFASPKRRAKETLEPLSHASQVPLTIDTRLDERHHGESVHDFEGRILALLEDLMEREPFIEKDQAIYLVSHLDWLESVMTLLPSDMSDLEIAGSWSNCEYRLFEVAEGIWSLKGRGHISG